MLKKEFQVLVKCYTNYVYSLFVKFHHDQCYGVTAIKDFDTDKALLTFDLFDKLILANRTISPAANLYLPDFITAEQFKTITTAIKAKL